VLITALEINDYKRIRKVAITPPADRHLVLLGGKNAQGKSSTLDALTAAFGGAKQIASDPVRHGADVATIFVELDGGKLTIERTITSDGKTRLEVRDEVGMVRSPQAVLDKLVGARFLDPLAFLALPAKEQRAQLMRQIEGADRIAQLDEKRARAFDRRTEVGRDLKKAEGELARLPEVQVGAPIDVAALNEEVRKLAELQRQGDGLGHAYNAAARGVEMLKESRAAAKREVEALERRLAEAREQLADLDEKIGEAEQETARAKQKLDDAVAAWTAVAPRRAELDAELARADEHNRAVYAADAQRKRRAEVAGEVEKLRAETDSITAVIAKIDERKAEILAAAKLPVDGLSIDDDGILLNGVPFAQASASERLRVALALAAAASPELGDVWIRDGALLDDESLELVAKHAAASGKRVWIERVGTKDPGAIVIQDGEVVS
jgi:DNA repair exonuclease SbcCD ATPase subunit